MLLAISTFVLRLCTRSMLLSDWDEVQYALGMHEFSVLLHQPQPPGSPFYELLGRASLALVGGDHEALLLNSMLASAGAVATVYALTRVLFQRRAAAVLAAAALATQPAFWTYGASGNAWTMLALLASAVGLCCVLLRQGHRALVLPSALVLGLASGFRLDVTVFMAPLWFWSVYRAEPRWRRRLLAAALVLVSVASWLIPVVSLTGGFWLWARSYVGMFCVAMACSSPRLSPGVIVRNLESSTLIEWGINLITLGPWFLLGVLWARRRCLAFFRTPAGREALRCVWLWSVPSFVFLWFVDWSEAGHNLLYLVGAYALAAGFAAWAAPSRRTLALAAVPLLLAQSALFFWASPRTGPPLAYTSNLVLLNFNLSTLRGHDHAIEQAVATIRSTYQPDDVAIVTLSPQTVYRFASYYLPEYSVVRLDTTGTQAAALEAAHRHQQWQSPSACLIDSSVHHLIVLLDADPPIGSLPAGARPVAGLAGDGNAFARLTAWDVRLPPAGLEYFGYRLGGCSVARPPTSAGIS